MRRLALLISCFLILLSTSVVRAKLGVSPMLLSLEAQPGTTVEVMVKAYVTSPSDSEIDVRLADLQDQRLKNFPWRVPQPALAGEGHDSPNSCQARISVESPGILHPDQDGRIAIPVTIDVSEDANSYYYAALVIRETSLKEGPLVVRGELVVPIFVRPRGAFYPFDIDVKGIVSTKDLSMMAATLSVPSSVILYQQDDTNNYAGSLSAFELATNFPVQMTASISPSESVLAELSTETPPSHNGGRTQFDLKVIANNVNLVGLTAGSHGVTLGDLTVQVIPDFSMSYSAQYLSMCKDGSRYSKPWFAAVGAYINQEKRKLDEAALVRFRGQECFFRKLGWLALQSRSVEILLDDNEEILEKAFYQTRLINGCLANADLWLEMLRSHYYDEKWLQRDMREWLQQEAIPWVLTFLGQWQQWQQTQEAINWQHQLDQACFLPTPDGALMSDPLVPMPSVASIGLMPMLPQEEMGSSTKDSTEHLFLDFYPFKGRELRSGLLEMMKDTHQLVIVDPRLGGEENLALCAEDVSLEVALDLIGLSLDAQWERYPGYYYLKPAPIVSMQQPFFFSRQGDKPNAELIKQNHNLQSDWFARCAYFLSEEIGIPIVCSPKATGNVTARLHDVPLEVALDALCISSGNQWKKGDDFYLIERRQDKSLNLNYPIEKSMPDSNEPTPGDLCWYWEDTPLEKVVANLSFETETNLVLDAGLDPGHRVTLICEDCSLEGVLNKLCRTIGCTWKKTPYFYWILPEAKGENLEAYPFQVTQPCSAPENSCSSDNIVMMKDGRSLIMQVLELHKRNLNKITTWRGEATVVKYIGDGDGVELFRDKQVSFVLDEQEGSVKWVEDVNVYTVSNEELNGNLPEQYINAGIVTKEKWYHYSPGFSYEGDDSLKNTLMIWPQEHYSRKDVTNFNPMTYVLDHPAAGPLYSRMEFVYNNWDECKTAGYSVERSGDMVTVTAAPRDAKMSWNFDLSKGGNLVRYRVVTPKFGTKNEFTWDFTDIDGIWVLASYEGIRQRVGNEGGEIEKQETHIDFYNQIINDPINSTEFSLESLRVASGTYVSDYTTGRTYLYYE